MVNNLNIYGKIKWTLNFIYWPVKSDSFDFQ